MKTLKLISMLLIAYMIVGFNDMVHATELTGQCVYPIGDPTAIKMYNLPMENSLSADQHIRRVSYYVGARSGWYVALWSVPDYTLNDPFKNAGTLIGWVKSTDVEVQDQRNCT